MRSIILLVAFSAIVCSAHEFHENPHPNATSFECISKAYPYVTMIRGLASDVRFQCTRMFCQPDGSIIGEICMPRPAKKGCYLTNPYLSLPYPHCCQFKQRCPYR